MLVSVEKKKVIGFCTTVIQANERVNFISELYRCLDERYFKLMVFNSSTDFEVSALRDDGEKAIYSLINYDIIDYLIIDSLHFKNRVVMDGIIATAKAHNCPILLLHPDKERDDCILIKTDYEDSYKHVVRHLVEQHNIKDFYYIGGEQGEQETERRRKYIEEVLSETGLSLRKECVAYGHYYEEPAKYIVEGVIERGELPEVFVCANDLMALGAYEALEERGYKVGKDVKVIGFDGLVYTHTMEPCLTTVKMTERELAIGCVRALYDITRGIERHSYTLYYEPVIAESCGCTMNWRTKRAIFKHSAYKITEQLRRVERVRYYEDTTFDILDEVFNIEEVPNLYSLWTNLVEYGGYICLKKDFANCVLTGNPVLEDGSTEFSDEYFVMLNSARGEDVTETVKPHKTKNMVPDLREWIEGDNSGIYVLLPITAKQVVCGHYAVRVTDIKGMLHRCNRTCRAIDIILTEGISRFKLMTHISGSGINSITGLPNLNKGNKWFSEFIESEEASGKTIMVSLYWIPELTGMYEKYGVEETEQDVRYIGESLKLANPYNSYISQISADEFVVVNWVANVRDVSGVINSGTGIFFGLRNAYMDKRKAYYKDNGYELEVNCGCTILNAGVKQDFITLVKLARTEMFVNRFKYSGVNIKSEEVKAKEDYKALKLLLDENLFVYNYQPIVDVKKGRIYAYEALMRTSGDINMSPLDILATAGVYKRLYDIERATMFNVMADYESRKGVFKGRKIFINSIPGYFLNETDKEILRAQYGSLFNAFVFEITEVGTASDEEVLEMKELHSKELGIPLAIDDYGAGHSNIVNLLRYSPQVIKIDRYLITDVDKDKNKQMFIKGTIDFAAANNIKVLAEGVETEEEFREVIKLGVDYVQGYYTGKPSREPMDEIPEGVLEVMREAAQERVQVEK